MSLIVTGICSERRPQSALESASYYTESRVTSSAYISMHDDSEIEGGLKAWARRRGGNLLVVDDSPVERAVTASLLERAGFQVVTACDGGEAVEILRSAAAFFDAVVMDVTMPGVDGLAATRQIRALSEAHAQMPIIALTANTEEQDRADCLDAGMNAHTSKPARLSSLLRAMRAHMPAVECG